MDIKIRIKLREQTTGEDFSLEIPESEESKLNNISLKTGDDYEFDVRPSNLQGMKLLSFKTTNFDRNQQDQIIETKSFKFNQNGILCNFDGQEGYLQSENEDNANEIVFGATDSNGEYEVTMQISSASGLSSFVIYGDSLANQFPTELTIDGVPFYSDDNKLVIPLDSTQDNHTIVFKKWNRPNYNACITIIRATKEYLTFSNTAIDSLKSVERNNVDASEINYGVLANSGSVEFLDADGEIQDLVNDSIIQNSNVPVDILLNENILQNHISNDSNYETAQKMFSMSLSNKIEMLDKLKYEGFAYPEHSMNLYEILYMVISSLNQDDELGYTDYTYFLRKFADKLNKIEFNKNHYTDSEILNIIFPNYGLATITFEQFYLLLIGVAPTSDKMQNIINLYEGFTSQTIPDDFKKLSTKRLQDVISISNKCMTPSGEKYIYEYLQNISIEYPVIEYGYTYRQVLDDICKIAQLNMFINKNNEFEFMSARPLLLSEDSRKMIRITRDTLKEPPSYDLFMKNKYQAIDISENKVSVKLDINSLISTYNSNGTSYITSFNSDDKSDLITGYYYCAYVKASYYTMTINIPKKINNNLITIESISNKVDDYGNSNIKYNVKYSHQTGNVIFTELPYFVSVSDMFKPNYTSNVNL